MPSSGIGNLRLVAANCPGLDPGSERKANLQDKVVSHQESVISKDLPSRGSLADD